MKKAITIICIILSILLILDTFNIWHALAFFYLAGQIPGTRTSLSADMMLQMFALLIGFVLARVTNTAMLSLFKRISTRRTRTALAA